jgi:nitrate reductase NapAB chaperone NapD
MAIASLIVQAKEGLAEQVVAKIEPIDGLTVHSVTENHEIIVVVEAPTLGEISVLGRSIEENEDVWSVTLAYANNEPDADLDVEIDAETEA